MNKLKIKDLFIDLTFLALSAYIGITLGNLVSYVFIYDKSEVINYDCPDEYLDLMYNCVSGGGSFNDCEKISVKLACTETGSVNK